MWAEEHPSAKIWQCGIGGSCLFQKKKRSSMGWGILSKGWCGGGRWRLFYLLLQATRPVGLYVLQGGVNRCKNTTFLKHPVIRSLTVWIIASWRTIFRRSLASSETSSFWQNITFKTMSTSLDPEPDETSTHRNTLLHYDPFKYAIPINAWFPQTSLPCRCRLNSYILSLLLHTCYMFFMSLILLP